MFKEEQNKTMTPEQKQTLHRILLDAKAEIKDGKLYAFTVVKCEGLCDYISLHRLSIIDYTIDHIAYQLIQKYGNITEEQPYIAPIGDFAHPDRLALLDWLINETKP